MHAAQRNLDFIEGAVAVDVSQVVSGNRCSVAHRHAHDLSIAPIADQLPGSLAEMLKAKPAEGLKVGLHAIEQTVPRISNSLTVEGIAILRNQHECLVRRCTRPLGSKPLQ